MQVFFSTPFVFSPPRYFVMPADYILYCFCALCASRAFYGINGTYRAIRPYEVFLSTRGNVLPTADGSLPFADSMPPLMYN